MIEKIVLKYLQDELKMKNVYLMVPEKPPNEYVVIEKTGSGRVNYINSASFAIQSCSSSLLKASELNEKVKKAMDSFPKLSEISSSKLETDYNFTNPVKKQPRYQAVYEITHY